MARINFDDEISSDNRFKRLVRKLGNEDAANGMLLRFWRLAQRYWGDEENLVPLIEFEDEGLSPILDCGLAEVRDAGVYAKGSEERFAWYLQKCRASKAAAAARAINRKQDSDAPEPQSRSTGTVIPDYPLAPAPVPAPVTVPDKLKKEIQACVDLWRDALKKHNADRDILPTEHTQLGRLIQGYGVESVKLALLGAKHEPASGDYKPSRHLRLSRIAEAKKFDYFVNLGAQAKNQMAARSFDAAETHDVDSGLKVSEQSNQDAVEPAELSLGEIRAIVGNLKSTAPRAQVDWSREPDIEDRQAVLREQAKMLAAKEGA